MSRSEFHTDHEFQSYWNQWFKDRGLDDGYSYLVSVDNGFIQKLDKMTLTPKKISKSS